MLWIYHVSFISFCCTLLSVDAVQYSNRWSVQIYGDTEEADRLARKHGFVNHGKIFDNYYSFQHRKVENKSRVPATSVQEGLSAEPNVKMLQQQVIKLRKLLAQSTSDSAVWIPPRDAMWKDMWYIHRDDGPTHNVIEVWKKNFTGQGVVVAVVDEGFNPNHPEIRDNYDPKASVDLIENDDNPHSSDKGKPQNGHGEHSAGVIAAVANRKCGIGLAYNAKIGGIRLYYDDMATDDVEAIALSFNRDYIDIYSNSWGPGDMGFEVDGPGNLTQSVLEEGANAGRNGKGSIYVFAAGNGGRFFKDCCAYDGYVNNIHTIAVTGINRDGSIPVYGEHCGGIMAVTFSKETFMEKTPVITAGLGHKCETGFGGSSAAAAMASGLIALTLSVNQNLTWRDVQHIIVRSARPAAVKGVKTSEWTENNAGLKVNDYVGFGLMDASRMASLAANWSTVPNKSICTVERIGVNRLIPSFEALKVSIDLTNMENACQGSMINYLEHVEVKVSLNYSRRGDLEMKLSSPSGTVSNLTHFRYADSLFENKELKNWVVMTLHLWGETAKGKWTLTLNNSQRKHVNKGFLFDWTLILHGTKDNPLEVTTHLSHVEISHHSTGQLTKLKAPRKTGYLSTSKIPTSEVKMKYLYAAIGLMIFALIICCFCWMCGYCWLWSNLCCCCDLFCLERMLRWVWHWIRWVCCSCASPSHVNPVEDHRPKEPQEAKVKGALV